MARTLWLALLFTHLLVIDCMSGKDDCLTQPSRTIWRKIGQAVVLQCTISSHCPTNGVHYQWFAFKESVHFRLNLSGDRYSLDGASLHIKSLQVNDSGIYHCAAASHRESSGCCAQHVGPGETLMVRDKVRTMVRHVLLLLAFVLLAIYSLALLTLVLVKKYGCSMSVCRKTSKTHKNTSSKKTQFRDVLQEMHRKGNLEKTKQATSGNRSRAEAAHDDSDGDGIYQNM